MESLGLRSFSTELHQEDTHLVTLTFRTCQGMINALKDASFLGPARSSLVQITHNSNHEYSLTIHATNDFLLRLMERVTSTQSSEETSFNKFDCTVSKDDNDTRSFKNMYKGLRQDTKVFCLAATYGGTAW